MYAGEYRHAVLALARGVGAGGGKAGPEHRAGLERHAEEEAAHVALWDEFARRRKRGGRDGGQPQHGGCTRRGRMRQR